MSPSTLVIGGGLAGITAALRCADAGHRVTVLEASNHLGGLTHSFVRGELEVDNGQHVLLRCCTEYLALLQRLGVSEKVTIQPRLSIPVRSPTREHPVWLHRRELPVPLHLGRALMGYGHLSRLERARFAVAALALRAVDPDDPATDRRSFAGWLAEHRQSERAVHALWELVSVATLNARPAECSLALAATVFQQGLLDETAAGDIGWPLVSLQRLHGEPATRALAASGSVLRTRSKVTGLVRVGERWQATTRHGELDADRVILAVPPRAAEHLLDPAALPLAPGWSQRLGGSPIVNMHLIYDRTVLDEPFTAGVDGPVQWVFDRTRQSGLHAAGFPPGSQYLAISLSAADDLIDRTRAELTSLLVPALETLLPRAREAELLDSFVTREREATFRPAPGTAALRPGPGSGPRGLYLAGAWTDTGWPATMEGAVRSGNRAAAAAIGAPRRSALQEAAS